MKFWQRKKKDQAGAPKATFWQRIWQNKARLGYLLGGLLALGLVAPLHQLYLMDRANPFIIVGLMLCVAGSGYLLYKAWKATGQEEAVIVGAEKPIGPINSLNIYAKKDADTGQMYPEKIAFELVNKAGAVVKEGDTLEKGERPPGQPWQCIDDGKWYHLNIWDIAADKLKPFILPDSQYFDPREFANVITMPAHKKLFERRQTLFQKLAPWIMLLGFIASGFFLLTTGG